MALTEEYKKVIIAIIIFVLGLPGVLTMMGLRPDKFGRTDYEREILKVREEFNDELKHCKAEVHAETKASLAELKADLYQYISIREYQHHLEIPPNPTRIRIKAIERCLETKCWETERYAPPTQQWYEIVPSPIKHQ